MDIDEIKRLKKELDDRIRLLIIDFQGRTGTRIDKVDVYQAEEGSVSETENVRFETKTYVQTTIKIQ